jgi:hypothetical protein
MGILAVGFISAAVSYFCKPVGLILALVGFLPLFVAFIGGPIQVLADPTSVSQATNSIALAFSNWMTGYLLNWPGAALFGAVLGLFGNGN